MGRLKGRKVYGAPIAEYCIINDCPHIRDNICPFWGPVRSTKANSALTEHLHRKRGCCFLRWSKEERPEPNRRPGARKGEERRAGNGAARR